METWHEVEWRPARRWRARDPAERPGGIRGATFTVEAVRERERVTDHDVAAFVDVLSESAGPAGRWIHFGLTSSDVLDTALALQLGSRGEVVTAGARELVAALVSRAREQAGTLCVGRTHGVHAEPDHVRYQAGRLRVRGRAQPAPARAWPLAQAAVGKISGAVGTYSSHDPSLRGTRAPSLGLEREPVSTQVVARDRHAELLQPIALAGSGPRSAWRRRYATCSAPRCERWRSRSAQAAEGLERDAPQAQPDHQPSASPAWPRAARQRERGLENVALWHERDISHSGAERVVLPDSTILLDYMQALAVRVVSGMTSTGPHTDNLDLTHGALSPRAPCCSPWSSGLSRDTAYRLVQVAAQTAFDEGRDLRGLLEAEPALLGSAPGDLDAVFDYGRFTRHSLRILARLERRIA